MAHIAIVGLGMIGGSLGMALRQAKADVQIVGHDRDPEVAAKARKRGAVDRTEWNLPTALDGAGLVIVAVPSDTQRKVFTEIAPHLSEGCVVTDTARAKRAAISWAAETLPAHVAFVGGRPIPSKAGTGIDNATATLFKDQAYCLTPDSQSDAQAIQLVTELAQLVGAKPYFLDQTEHDSLAAGSDDLPALMAVALLNSIEGDYAALARIAGARFADLAGQDIDSASHPALNKTNLDAVALWLDRYAAELQRVRTALVEGSSSGLTMDDLLEKARDAQARLRKGASNSDQVNSGVKTGEVMRHILLGGRGERQKR
jgi:prephenate dehydrogenase